MSLASSAVRQDGDSMLLGSMTFAVHPLARRRASPRGHRMPGGGVACGDVSVAGQSAGRAPEAGLALARSSVRMPARAASLAGPCRAGLSDPARSLV